jgi:hypothetical protein
MVVVLKKPNLQLQNFFHYDVDLLIVSFDSVPWLGYVLRVGELVVDSLCALPLLEPYIGILEMM